MAGTPAEKRRYFGTFTSLLLLLVPVAVGDLEPVLGRCCAYGANWAREGQQCGAFPAPVVGVPSEHQSVCLTSVGICCLRYFRDEQCQKGRQAAQVGQDCIPGTGQGAEYFKDCCQGCKLGLVSGIMGMGCNMRFKFGLPWDKMFVQCCNQVATSSSTSSSSSSSTFTPGDYPSTHGVEGDNLYPGITSPGSIPEGEDLCARFPGKLCAHVCVPIPGSYRCQCRAGFTLSSDAKTCIQDTASDRCQLNNPCAHQCLDTGIAIECSCNPGYTLAADQRSCQDVDECLAGTNNCDRVTQFCLNTPGGFTCQENSGPNDCIAGYKFSLTQQTCVDIDECAEKLDSCDWARQTCINSVGSFRCIDRRPTCDFGYQYNEEQSTCVDVDECEENPGVCRSGSECRNTLGSYQCGQMEPDSHICQPGYTFNTTARACTDIDECSEGRHDCSLVETCINRLGSYACEAAGVGGGVQSFNTTAYSSEEDQATSDYEVVLAQPRPTGTRGRCEEGYRYNRRRRACVDIDECASSPCEEGENCRNTQGSFQCTCQVGYVMDEEQCTDVNECQLGLHECTNFQRCDNTVGSYACVRISGCGTGYTLNHNTGECDDNDECKLKTHNCDPLGPKYHCVNIKGSFRCKRKTCPLNQVLDTAGACVNLTCGVGFMPLNSICIDINECVVGGLSSPCNRNERCINTLGSYQCRPLLLCGAGYKMNEVGSQCIDIDECEGGTHQCEGNQLCSNRQGGYICQCPPGYRLNAQRQCQDINECESYYSNVCSNNAECENTPGSYRCLCKEGFKESPNGNLCIDIDECTEVPGICHHNCLNVWGSHQCTCRAGYLLTSDNRTCEDINECEEVLGRGRLCIGFCVNNPGSFSCSCPDGYTLAADGRTCKDVNECESGTVCRNSEDHCVNTRGGFKCNTITCPENYIRDTRHRNRCKKETTFCLASDEACQLQPLSYSYNFLPLVSNMTLPPLGQVDLFTMRGPLWATTTVQFSLELDDATAPPGIPVATQDFFYLKRTSFNQAVISLVRPVLGPQEIDLALNMKLYQQGQYTGSAVAKLLIYVSKYEF